jgi:sterol 3beta-glucosyltransferase
MHISVLAYGTWGDVRPATALALGLKRAGYGVRLILTKDFGEWVRDTGLDVGVLSIDERQVMRRVSTETHPLRVALAVHARLHPALRQAAKELPVLVSGTDALLANEWMLGAASGIAEAHDLQLIHMALQPIIPTRQWAIPTMPEAPAWFPLEETYNGLTFRLSLRLRWWLYGRSVNSSRRTQLHLGPLSGRDYLDLVQRTPSVTLVSQHVIPRPGDWGDRHRMTGFVFHDDPEWSPPAGLVDFIQDGSPPVYVGFGSMHDSRPADTTRKIVDALGRSGQRAVLYTGWAGLGLEELPGSIYCLDYAPHGWLFPRMAAIVHHAGAGTSAAALRAGVPSVPIPHSGDQDFWARRLIQLGAGTVPLPRSRLSAGGLANRIARAVRDPELRSRAAEFRQLIRQEDGVARTISALEALLHTH